MGYNNTQVTLQQRVDVIAANEQLFVQAISSNDIVWEKEKQYAIQCLQSNDYLAGMAVQNPASMQNAIINVANIGISLNPALKHAYLVPRKGSVCLDISYMGLLHIAQSSGVIKWGQAKIVHQNDDFQLQGLSKEPIHSYNPFGDRGEIIGVYCTVKTVDGDYLTETMNISEVYQIRDRSESFKKKKSGPWVTDEGEMIKKTVIKRAYKLWPKCERLGIANQMLNDNGEGINDDVAVITQDEYEQERLSSISEIKVECENVCKQMEGLNDLVVLERLFKAMARKIIQSNCEKFMVKLTKAKDEAKMRIMGQQND